MFRFAALLSLVLGLLLPPPAWAVPGETPPPTNPPQIAAASEEGQQAMANFQAVDGLKVELVAAEPLLANPVAFAFDSQGRLYVCETFRQGRGVEDNRGHGHWLDDDLAAQTVADRAAYIEKHLGAKAATYTHNDDRIRLLTDADGDGKYDRATVFAEGFNSVVSGTGAGVLADNGNVYYTCIPDLLLLRDTNGDGKADVRKVLHTGYGVRFAFRGHDMHGLVIGPDGRLYFSIGDRGLNVQTPEGKQLVNPSSGAVLRCNLDGSQLEMIATGLRNPQELAFDDYGNLFTGDNNSDSGDKARVVNIVEGGDSGWRMEYQYLPDRGPFNRERIWHPFAEGEGVQPAYIVPPILNFASGPSGLAFYPGTGLPKHFDGRFFLCDFRGGPGNSGVRTFRLKPSGASFELIDAEESLWKLLATDVEFGPDGGVYVSDWVNGWNGEGKGRIYKFFSPEVSASPEVAEVRTLLAAGFAERSTAELAKLLAHADRRVRQGAQFALVAQQAQPELATAAEKNENLLARLHGIWGLEQLVRGGKPAAVEPLARLLGDADAEVRAQAAKAVGDSHHVASLDPLIALLKDDSLRVRFFAAQSLGKLGDAKAIEPLLAMLAENADQDPVLRHGGVMGLVGSAGAVADLTKHALQGSPAERLAIVLALRRMHSGEVAIFLNDAEPKIVLEAARAIHDLPLVSALPELAALIVRPTKDDALLRRVLDANYRLGTPESATALAAFAARDDAPEAMRLEALAMLDAWAEPSPKDRVTNAWRPLEPRDKQAAVAAVRNNLPGLFRGSSKLQAEAAKVAAHLGIQEVIPALLGMLADKSQPERTRADALGALASLKAEHLDELVHSSLTDESPAVRAAARNELAKLHPDEALPSLEQAVLGSNMVERQAALAFLATFGKPGVNAILSKALDKLLAGDYPADSRLDLLAAAEKHASGEIKSKVARYEAERSPDNPLAPFAECLVGGDAARGRQIFFERVQVSCVRCHKIQNVGGDVGPELSKIAGEKKRDYLLEAVVAPSKTIAKNFATAVIVDLDGIVHTGIVKFEDAQRVDLMTAEGKLISVAKDNIDQRKEGKSAMPDDLTRQLTKSELRDLIEFLSGLK